MCFMFAKSKKRNLCFPQSGFSLIELMVVFSLIAIVSGIGFASFAGYSRRQTLSQAASDLKSIIDRAKFDALSSVKPASLCPGENLVGYKVALCSTSPLSCLSSSTQSDYQLIGVCSSRDYLIIAKKLPQNISIVTANNTTTCGEISFDSLSNSVRGTPCVIGITGTTGYGSQLTLSVDQGGNVSIE